jgi:hypothetical protein
LNVLLYGGYIPQAGDRFDIINWGTLTGTFGTLNLPALSTGLAWDTSKLYTTGVLSVVSTANGNVPLPAWALAAMGLGLLGLSRRFTRVK